VLADQLEADGVAERLLAFLRQFRIGSADLDVDDVEGPLKAACAAEAAQAAFSNPSPPRDTSPARWRSSRTI